MFGDGLFVFHDVFTFFCLTLMKFLRPGGCGSVWDCC